MKTNTSTAGIPTQQHIKQMHLKEIFLLALRSGGISRAELRQALQLSFPSTSALVEELLARGVLVEDGTMIPTERGRPRSMLRVNAKAFSVPVAVMTPEGYRCTLFDCCGTVLQTVFLPYAAQLPAVQLDMEALGKPLQDWLGEVRQRHTVAPLILAISGNFNESGAISSSIIGFSTPAAFHRQLQQMLDLSVIIFNNADCYAYAEQYCQKLPEDFIAVTVSRGVGAGIIRHGAIFDGGFFRAGELGHISIDHSGEPCSCGGRGCLEKYINTRQITKEACQLLQLPEETAAFDDIAKIYREKRTALDGLISEKAGILALGISNMLTMQPVTHIVIGGEIVKLGDRFLAELRKYMKTVGLRKFMDRVTVSYTRNSKDPEAFGSFQNYLDHHLDICAAVGTNKELCD